MEKNQFLKALAQELYDLEKAGEDIAGKQWSILVSAAIKAGMDLPQLISHLSSAGPDMQALLADPSADADLLAFVVALVADQTKAAKIVVAIVDLALAGVSLAPKMEAVIAAFKS